MKCLSRLKKMFCRKKDDLCDVDFLLYDDPLNKDQYKPLIHKDRKALKRAKFDTKRVTKVLIHGISASATSPFPQDAKDAYFGNRFDNNYNVIIVNWSNLAMNRALTPNEVARKVVTIGNRVGKFLVWLSKNANMSLRGNVHVVGFGEGAHIAGKAGHHCVKEARPIGRISGLSPTGPLFDQTTNHVLSRYDAFHVDVYHTNRGVEGTKQNLGHVDFMVNGGKQQPNCLTDRDSHAAAHKIWTHTIWRGLGLGDVSNQFRHKTMKDGYRGRVFFGEHCLPGPRNEYEVDHDLNAAN